MSRNTTPAKTTRHGGVLRDRSSYYDDANDELKRAEFGARIDDSEHQSTYGDWFGDDRLEPRPVLVEVVDKRDRVQMRLAADLYERNLLLGLAWSDLVRPANAG